MRKTTQRYVSLRQRAGRAICSFATAAALAALGCSIAATNAVAQERHELSYTGDLIDILPQLRQIDPSMTITRSGTFREVPVAIAAMNAPKLEILRLLGEQAGDKADLIYSPKANQLKIVYKDAPAPAAVKQAPAVQPVKRNADGSVEVLFGSARPELQCQPMEVCAIELQPGETVNSIDLGDTARWQIQPTTVGQDERQAVVLLVRPSQPKAKTTVMVTLLG
jgi:type IV secretion system protein VirB9